MCVLSLEPMRVIQNKKGEYHFSDILQCLIILYLLYCHFWSKLADFTDVFIRGCSVFDISIYHRNDVVNGNGMIKKNNDNPPCQKAKNRYIQKLDDDDDYFKCTEENEKQDPVVFEIKSDGIWFDDGSKKKKQESKSSSIGKREHLYG